MSINTPPKKKNPETKNKKHKKNSLHNFIGKKKITSQLDNAHPHSLLCLFHVTEITRNYCDTMHRLIQTPPWNCNHQGRHYRRPTVDEPPKTHRLSSPPPDCCTSSSTSSCFSLSSTLPISYHITTIYILNIEYSKLTMFLTWIISPDSKALVWASQGEEHYAFWDKEVAVMRREVMGES